MKLFLKKLCVSIFALTFVVNLYNPINNIGAEERTNLSYTYFVDNDDYERKIDATNESLDMASLNMFNIDDNGSLMIDYVIDEKNIDFLHSQNIKVIPFLSNHWNRELGVKALDNYKEISKNIVDTIVELNLDGINIDLENLSVDEKDKFVTFIKYLNAILPGDKELSVAIAANPYSYTTGWHGSYDYEELSKYCDYIVLMTYDESYSGSKPGPVASIDFVEDSIKQITEFFPSDKILLGIPFYGRYWNLNKSFGGSGFPLNQVNSLIDTYDVQANYDFENKTPYITFKINSYDPDFYVYGNLLSSGNYVLWYENESSIKSKLILVEKYNLKGTASWSLGQENEDIWQYYKEWLNGNYYEDISESWACNEINFVTINGLMDGKSSINFAPESNITRAEMAAVLCRLLNLDNYIVNESMFNDVYNSHWAYDYINTVYSNNIMIGNDNSFNPDECISREEASTIFYRILNGNKTASNSIFTDVSNNRWSKDYVLFCYENNIFNGYSDNTFRPESFLTREELAALLTRVYNSRFFIN